VHLATEPCTIEKCDSSKHSSTTEQNTPLQNMSCTCYTHPAVSPSVCSCVSVTMITRRGSCGFCPSFVTTIIHQHTAAGATVT